MKAAEYVEGRKVAGVRSLATAKGQLSVLRDHFGACQLRSITHGDVRQFRATRLAQKTRTEGQRSIASVNRELSMLRRMVFQGNMSPGVFQILICFASDQENPQWPRC